MRVTHWPLYGLVLRTPRLELRLPSLPELDELAEVAIEGVHDPAEMPFRVPWTDAPAEELGRNLFKHHWSTLGSWSPDDWTLPLCAFADGRPAGTQDVMASDFAIVREISTGSWLGLRHQRKGLGTEMRAAVLHLAFAGLGAESAASGAHLDNHASMRVSRRLGYEENGVIRAVARGRLVHEKQFVLSRERWERHRTVPVEVEGLPPCRDMFGPPVG